MTFSDFSDRDLYGLPVAIFDFETTGLDLDDSRPVSLAIVHHTLGSGDSELVYYEKFDPCVPIPPESSAIHGIYDSDVVGCRSFSDEWPIIREFFLGRLLCAYHLPFDFGILNSSLRRHGHSELMWHGICGKVLASYVDRDESSHSLLNVASRRGIEYSAHRADEDALVVGRILDGLLSRVSRMRGRRFGSYRDYWGWQREYAIRSESCFREYLRRKGDTRERLWAWTDW